MIAKFFTYTIWLLTAQVAVSSRNPGGWDFNSDVTEGTNDGCVKVDNSDRAKLVSQIPPDVYVMLEKRDLTQEYYDLANSLHDAKKGTLGAWKSSSLYRTMYIRGYEEAFKAKHVSMYLTKTAENMGSIIKVCFVDRLEQPDYMPPDIYNDELEFQFTKGPVCKQFPHNCKPLSQYPKGVYRQVYDGYPDVKSDKMLMPVDFLKFMEKKDLVLENMDMAAMINSGVRTGFSAAQVVASFKQKFFAKGVKIFYCQKAYQSDAQIEWHHWFEYADVEEVGEDYIPTINGEGVEYPQKFLTMYNECKNGDTKNLTSYIATHAGQKTWGECRDVGGATARTYSPFPKCKCKAEDAVVFCGDRAVATRKFDIVKVLSLAACQKRLSYCSVRACLPPDDRP